MRIKFFAFASTLFIFINCFSQNDAAVLNQTFAKDSSVNALALYPKNVRDQILEVCSHPDALVRMETIQKDSKEQFKNILAKYDKTEQQKIWDITRYPGLVDSLVRGGKKSKEQINELLKSYPSEIHETTLKYGRSYFDALSQINSLNKKTDSDFESAIKEYPQQTQNALREIVKYPDIVSILGENMHTTVLVGDLYKRNPEDVRRKLDSLNIALSKQNAKELEDWKNGLEKNPEAKKEYEESAKEYAKQQGYSSGDLEVRDPEVVVNYVVYPYPYWYGSPWWWDYPHWYPYPYWYDWGFYYGPYGMTFIGFPSWYFTTWYFSYYPHHYHYNHFSDYCVGHYYGHHNSVSGVHAGVGQWVHKTEPNLPGNFFASDMKRPDRIKELGKFEMDYAKTGATISRDNFLHSNAASYPSISPVLNEKPRPALQQMPAPRPNEHQAQPQHAPPATLPRQNPVPRPMPQGPRPPAPRPPTPRPQAPIPQPHIMPGTPRPGKIGRGPLGENTFEDEPFLTKDGFMQMNEAQCYHRYCWNPR